MNVYLIRQFPDSHHGDKEEWVKVGGSISAEVDDYEQLNESARLTQLQVTQDMKPGDVMEFKNFGK